MSDTNRGSLKKGNVMGLLILFGNLRGNFPLVLKID